MTEAPKNRMDAPALDRWPAFTNRDLILEAQREASMRRNVYAKRVSAGRMLQQDADRRIDMMEAIASRLTRLSHIE